MSLSPKNRLRGRLVAAAVAVLLAAGGATAIAIGIWGNPPPPQPPAAAATPTPHATPTTTPPPTSPATPVPAPTIGPILAAATPTHITVPAIGIDSKLITLGQNSDGTVQTPPLNANAPAGWYTGSPTPGQLGPAVILGHVDAWNGRSVFYSLGNMRPGDQITITRSDGTVAVFTTQSIGEYPKNNFPTLQVYGNTDRAELRLITCGGDWNDDIGHYVDNIVVYARLVSSHPA